MTFYIKINKEDYIVDCIEQPHNDYIIVNFDVPLPNGFLSGVYKYLGNNKFELDHKKRDVLISKELSEDILI